jgi:predicted permease
MSLVRDLRVAGRGLRKSAGFAAACVVTLALGIGINTAIFSVIYAVLLRGLPYGEADRLCVVWKSIPKKNLERDWTSYPTYEDWKRKSRGFEEMAAFLRPDGSVVNLSEGEAEEQIQAAKVSWNFFPVLGTNAILGRTFSASQMNSGANVTVLSYDFWRARFRGAKDIVGKKLKMDGAIFEVLGVMPEKFAFPGKDTQVWADAKDTQVWVPLDSDARWPKFQTIRLADAFGVIGRLKPGISVEREQADMNVVAQQLAREHPETDLDLGIRVIPLASYIVAPRLRLTLWLFFGAVVLVLLIACANVAGLFLSRTFARRKMFAIQAALGAGRRHIVQQVFAEAVVLAVAAGVMGIVLAAMGVKALTLVAPANIPGVEAVRLNGWVLTFAFVTSFAAAILSSVVPAVRFSAADPQMALRESVGAGGREGNRMRGVFVFAECALAIVLLTGTGLLLRSAARLARVDLGFRADHLVSVSLRLHGQKYDDDNQIRAFVDETIRRVSAIPGVKSASIGAVFLARLPNSRLEVEGRPAAGGVVDDEPVTWTYVSEGFFETLGIPLLRGRNFTTADGPEGMPVVIVNGLMARRLWPGQDPVGKRFKYGVPGQSSKQWLTVVGVAGDTVQNGPETKPVALIYYPVRQKVWETLELMVRSEGEPTAIEKAVGDEARAVDKTIPLAEISTVEQHLWEMGAQRRFQIELFGLFALLANVLAAVGIYGVMAYMVGQRTLEIGVRMALGARRGDVLKMILREGLAPALLGLLAGTGLAMAVMRVMAGLLFGVTATDPVTYLEVSLVVLVIVTLAAVVPARRAMRVDPMLALRYE